MLHLAIGLPVKDPSRLKTELNELYDPNSPQFHEFLSPERFAQQYGASEKDYQSLIAFARANGLRVTATYPDHLLLAVDGSAASINKTFHISLANRRRPDGSEFYSPDREPSVDIGTKILHVSGLDNFELPKRAGAGGSGTGGALGGSDFRNAYAPGVSLTGKGETVGLYGPIHRRSWR